MYAFSVSVYHEIDEFSYKYTHESKNKDPRIRRTYTRVFPPILFLRGPSLVFFLVLPHFDYG